MMDLQERAGEPRIGSGIYTVAEAARLLRVTSRRLKGWAEGYRNRRGDEIRTSKPVIDREASVVGLLTFHELIELFFVRQFVQIGVKLPTIRVVHEILRTEWNTPYPFAYNRLYSDGRELLSRQGDHYREIANYQDVFTFAEYFFRDLDFTDDRLASRWWPLGRNRLIVLDPKRAFGAPIDVRSGMRTEVLYLSFLAEERDAKAVAEWYEVPEEGVTDAVEFEERWLKAA